jgi:dTDP-4-dehydrorhamnose reductase
VSDPLALVLGAGGQLGQACVAAAPPQLRVNGLTRVQCDVTDEGALRDCLQRLSPQIIINAAAYTAVDAAEDDRDTAQALNAQAPQRLATLCAERGIRLVHVSTDFVFDGAATTPYLTTDSPAPLGVYGKTKLQGEQAVLAGDARHAVVRTSWVYAPQGKNFMLTMLRLMRERGAVGVVSDQMGAPTAASSLADICWRLAQTPEAVGLFHWSDEGEISWYEFACAIRDEATAIGLLTTPVTVDPIATSAFPTVAKRPAYSVLNAKQTCYKLGVVQRPWRDALRDNLRAVKAREF